MISSVHIEGFKGFKNFKVNELGRVNLLVGTNNSGKTSLLEALHLLTSEADPWALWQILWRRGERAIERTRRPEPGNPEMDASHLFNGHEFHVGSRFSLTAKNQTPERSLIVEAAELNEAERASMRFPGTSPPKMCLRIKGTPPPALTVIPLATSGALSSDSLDIPRRTRRPRQTPQASEESRVQYITTEAMDGDYLVALWNGITLTPDEDLILSTLACLDPDIERIAAQASTSSYWGNSATRSGFVLKHKKFDNPVPIGSMGDGIWRLFSLAIAITQCRGGVLLVDEIDTGLHHTAMSDMWKLILSAAVRFDVQVFATTHSSDCVHSLAISSSEYLSNLDDTAHVTLQRIEQDQDYATPYTSEEIQIAAKHSVEIR